MKHWCRKLKFHLEKVFPLTIATEKFAFVTNETYCYVIFKLDTKLKHLYKSHSPEYTSLYSVGENRPWL